MDDENLLIIREDNIRKFWISFTTWFEGELPEKGILQPCYEEYNNWDEGYYYLSINFEKEYKLHYGMEYPNVLKLELPQIEDIKMFIELAFNEWIFFEKRYDFTVMVNKRLSSFSQVMQDFDVNLICVEDDIDSSKDTGKLMISVLSAVAEIGRENIRIQTMKGLSKRRVRGKWKGVFAPYGYQLVKGQLEINETEATAIRIIYDQYVQRGIRKVIYNAIAHNCYMYGAPI